MDCLDYLIIVMKKQTLDSMSFKKLFSIVTSSQLSALQVCRLHVFKLVLDVQCIPDLLDVRAVDSC